MSSLILRTSVRFLTILLIIFAVFLFFRGHHSPGGGFGAGLVTGAAIGLYSLTYSVAEAQKVLRVDPRVLIMLGLLTALFSGWIGVLADKTFLTGIWWTLHLGELGEVELGTPLLFDLGVFLVVVGASHLILMMLQESE